MGDHDRACKEPETAGEGDSANALLANGRYGCFCFPCFPTARSAASEPSWWERVKASKFDSDDHWWSAGLRPLKKIREWSELVAGPRWKTFIRRFNRNRGTGGKLGRFQYDPISYALNFDEGSANMDFEDDEFTGGFQNFSGRFASVPAPAKSAVSGTV